jgi:hypothetical protein
MAKTPAESFGEVTTFRSGPRADYAEMRRPIRYLHQLGYMLTESHDSLLTPDQPNHEVWMKEPFVWTRQYAFVKDDKPTGDNYLVVRDRLPGNHELSPSLDLWALADKLDVNGQVGVFTGQYGVDLHCYVAEPATFEHRSHRVGHTAGFGFAKHYEETFKKPFEEFMLSFQIAQPKKDGGYFVAMVPVKRGDAPPKFETVLDGKAIRVTLADRIDTIVMLDEPGEVTVEGRKLNGKALLVSRTAVGSNLTVTNLDSVNAATN